MTRVTVHGATGRLGSAVLRRVLADPSLELVAAVARPTSAGFGRDVGEFLGLGPKGIAFRADLPKDPGLIFDASRPDALPELLSRIENTPSTGLVAATTGYSAEALAQLKRAGERAPVIFLPNLSLGVAILKRLVAEAAQLLPEADIEIIETHHRHKADAPSGTAKLLAEAAAEARGSICQSQDARGTRFVCGREGQTGPRGAGDIGIHALRQGDVVGEHTVIFAWDSQRIELAHKAHSREVFAAGALDALRFLARQGPGYYTVDDLVRHKLREGATR